MFLVSFALIQILISYSYERKTGEIYTLFFYLFYLCLFVISINKNNAYQRRKSLNMQPQYKLKKKEKVNIFFIRILCYFILIYFYWIGKTIDFKITLTKNIYKPVQQIKLNSIQSINIVFECLLCINMLISTHAYVTAELLLFKVMKLCIFRRKSITN